MMSRPITIERWLVLAGLAIATPVAAQPPAQQTPPAIAPPKASPPPPGPRPGAPTPKAPPPEQTAQLPDVTATYDEPALEPSIDEGETIEIVDKPPPGSKATIDKAALERDEYDDLHKVLGGTAGVYLRDEDGYGLRPNIGMRGAAADRSAKITLMEDGVLIAPAPYTAPAAYYTPLVTRMSRVEVTKGPSAIRFGPNTVGGAIDLIGEPFPSGRMAYVDVAGGSDMYGKLHARAAERSERWGVMAEYVKLRSDGFKQLDGGGDTGFDKDDVQVTARLMSPPTATDYHTLDLRVGYGQELSNETYTGLATMDFAANPQRRYVASQLDQMSWDHWRMRATHKLELGLRTRVETAAYRHTFHRAWGKVDGFVGQPDFYGLLANPSSGLNQVYYAILTGQADSAAPEEQLILGTNDRDFTSQGIQTTVSLERATGPFVHHIDAGARVHFDRADRRRYEDTYNMISGVLERTARPRATVVDTRAETVALATFVEDRVHYKRLEVVGGLRLELIDYRFQNQMAQAPAPVDGNYAVLIPGGGVLYHVTDQLSVLGGVHRGFVPVAPSAAVAADPESSINYEAGARWRDDHVRADVIGFFSDYANLKGSCTLASGCTDAQDGQEFNGGAAFVYGVEAQVGGELPLHRRTKLVLPVAAAYTLTRSEFRSTFSSDFAGWGNVMAGDELPYLPQHLVSLSGGVKVPRGELAATARYRSESRDVAGRGPIAEHERAEALFTLDLAAHARIHAFAELYATCSNVFDEQVIVSRRPYGARPNAPRMFMLGYKGRF
jgi:Fe(3+) dicitrate transport protein